MKNYELLINMCVYLCDICFTKKANDPTSLCGALILDPAQIFKYMWIDIS